MRQLTPLELQGMLARDRDPPLLLDVREPWEVAVAWIEGALNLPIDRVMDGWHQLDPAREMAVICHHGFRSAQVVLFLEHAGFERVANLDGGIDAWSREVDPTVPTY
ncbi:MAG: sulfurtransferase [Candidatus Competibacteraceae bacterium]|nr:MAG: sulfurtransferase [Candidatus Competibacteraceae bacterium]